MSDVKFFPMEDMVEAIAILTELQTKLNTSLKDLTSFYEVPLLSGSPEEAALGQKLKMKYLEKQERQKFIEVVRKFRDSMILDK